MPRNHRTRSALLLAVVGLAGAGCSDDATRTTPTAPLTVEPLTATRAKARPRVPYISSLQLSSIYIPLSGGYTPFTVTVTNPSPKDFQGIYLKGELKSQNNQPPSPATAFLAYCPNPNGIVPRGDCTMTNGITANGNLSPGPGTYTLRVVQRQSDGTMIPLDSTTVAVELRQYY